ncbi:MAG TPA: hypothetical protein GXX29_10165, partial [Firmicutes bacterium]|nr:hypothetical protein [Bacillota bacterium]
GPAVPASLTVPAGPVAPAVPDANSAVPAPAPFVLLCHSSAVYKEAEQAGVDLLCAGHTHGGQVCLPFFGAIYTNDDVGRRFASGLKRYGRMAINVSRGIGWAKLRVRFFCRPALHLLIINNT